MLCKFNFSGGGRDPSAASALLAAAGSSAEPTLSRTSRRRARRGSSLGYGARCLSSTANRFSAPSVRMRMTASGWSLSSGVATSSCSTATPDARRLSRTSWAHFFLERTTLEAHRVSAGCGARDCKRLVLERPELCPPPTHPALCAIPPRPSALSVMGRSTRDRRRGGCPIVLRRCPARIDGGK